VPASLIVLCFGNFIIGTGMLVVPGMLPALNRRIYPLVPLMDVDFVIPCQLVRHRMPRSGSCSSARAFASTLLSHAPRGVALALRFHFTSIRL
jgi:hypothetical protein